MKIEFWKRKDSADSSLMERMKIKVDRSGVRNYKGSPIGDSTLQANYELLPEDNGPIEEEKK